MSEEIRRATVTVPRAMVFSTAFNGLLAFTMLITFLFCAGTITDEEISAPYPFIPILARVIGSDTGATVLVSLIIALQFCACLTSTATASRMMWAFARDHGLPFWRFLVQVSRNTVLSRDYLTTG
jgi:choline transport protein